MGLGLVRTGTGNLSSDEGSLDHTMVSKKVVLFLLSPWNRLRYFSCRENPIQNWEFYIIAGSRRKCPTENIPETCV